MKISFWISQIVVYTFLLVCQFTHANTKTTKYWTGKLVLSETVQMDVALEYFETENGYKAKFHSVSQNTFDIKVTGVSIINQKITFTIPSLMATFQGAFHNETTIDGQLTQGGNQAWSLTFNKVAAFPFSKPNRPQEPTGIVDYVEIDVFFKNPTNGITLAGTLTLPKHKKDFPTVVLLSGSGPNDRDQTIFGHKNFLVLSDLLTKAGIGVLRVDDRGVGESQGDFGSASVLDLAIDASAAVDYLATYSGINPNRIGLVGHSLGAELAPIVAAQNRKVHFIVMMAGGAKPLSEVILEQTQAIYKDKVSASAVALNTAILNSLFDSLKQNEDLEKAKAQFIAQLAFHNTEASKLTAQELQILELKFPLTTDGFNHFFTPNWKIDLFYDCTANVSKISIPVLAMNGTLDQQVVPDNLKLIEQRLQSNTRIKSKTILFKGLNHMFQPAKTGMPDEYDTIEVTIDQNVVNEIIKWITNL